MGQPLLALFISAKRHGSGPAPSGSASNDKQRLVFTPLLAQTGGRRRVENARLPGYLRHQLVPLFASPSGRRRTLRCDEHGVHFFPFQETRRLACVPTPVLAPQTSTKWNQPAMTKLGISVGILLTVFCFSIRAQTVNVVTLDQAGAQTVLQAARESAQQRNAPRTPRPRTPRRRP
jgi:hypothetical protein